MLVIRPAQMKAFRPAADEAFVSGLVEFVRERMSGGAVRLPEGERELGEIEDGRLRELILVGVARARGYGFTWERNLAAFVLLMLTVAPNFDEHPLIGLVLKDKSRRPDARIDELWRHVTPENIAAAKEGYNPLAWDAGKGA